MVRGAERKDINDYLYRVSPDNVILALDYTSEDWACITGEHLLRGKDRISLTNLEQDTEAYSVLNLSGLIEFAAGAELRLGVENLLNEAYFDHLAAYSRAYTDIQTRSRMPGLGRNIYGRLMWYF